MSSKPKTVTTERRRPQVLRSGTVRDLIVQPTEMTREEYLKFDPVSRAIFRRAGGKIVG